MVLLRAMRSRVTVCGHEIEINLLFAVGDGTIFRP